MRCLRYFTHPQVRIDPNVRVPHWGLSDFGRARAEAFKVSPTLLNTKVIVSSAETKALETAAILASQLHFPIMVRDDAHENDRSATGFLPPPEFEKMADAFFAKPEESVLGWERAIDAQHRIVKVAEEVMAHHPDGDILMVGHGGVGTLLYCHLARVAIGRMWDQPAGGGNIFCYSIENDTMLHGWVAMESVSI